jgi:hypothetical protein
MAINPPLPPWVPLTVEDDAGWLSIYYSDDLSRLPIRFVTKPGDNKSDPNLETGTYGLFSTCSPGMRASIIRRGHPNIFFATRWQGQRVLAGMYHIAWYAPAASARKEDYYLAADEVYFVDEPIPLSRVDEACRTNCNRRFRGNLRLSAPECARIKRMLLRRANAVGDYVSEIDRIERFSLVHSGFRYPSWRRVDGFDWTHAIPHLKSVMAAKATVVNSSTSGRWICSNCGQSLTNKALLRQCPYCGQLGTLSAS